jgi:hypothetical protein
VPECWRPILTYNGYPKIATTNHSTPNSLQFSGGEIQIMATPSFAAEVNTFEVNFWLNKQNDNSGTFTVGVMSNVLDPNTFVPIRDVTPSTAGAWVYIEAPLINAAAGNHFIAFRQSSAGAGAYYLDDVDVHLLP